MDGPPAMALGLDPASRDTMQQRPRPRTEAVLTRQRWHAIALSAVTMAVGTLAVLDWAPGPDAAGGAATVAGTMAFNTFVLYQFVNLLNSRDETRTVFHTDTLRNRWLWLSLVTVLALQIAVTHLGPLQQLFDTTSITLANWAICALVASTGLWIEEARKLIRRTRTKENHQ